ncbi:Dyp-type peroxidase [Nonomuraea mangrovi]|uniref:Dyp-type peroxidase n=1 Tax=Nonomuraea mangrovi TaxID=2316207 RepID=A0ABW4T4A7_9ACTN
MPESVSRRGAIASIVATAGVAATGGALLTGGLNGAASGHAGASDAATPATPSPAGLHGVHQPGIATRQQHYAMFAAFDLQTANLPTAKIATNLQQLMTRWTTVAQRLMLGDPPGPIPGNRPDAPAGSGVADGLNPASLTLTFGLGPEVFDLIGQKERRPAHLRPLPAFSTDRLEPAWSGGHLIAQICADDPQVVSHAFRSLRGQAPGLARLRWSQQGFLGTFGGSTPRNLLGQKDGTSNPKPGTPEFDQAVWAADGEPEWFTGGSYLVFRKIRLDLPKWDLAAARDQDLVIGRRRDTGAPLSGGSEFTAVELGKKGPDGRPAIPADAHVALVRAIPMLRRSYNYDYAVQGITEPIIVEHGHANQDDGHLHEHHSGNSHGSYDSGVLFCAYVRDPEAFIRAQRKLAGSDRLNAFVKHTGSAVFAIPPGSQPGEHLAAALSPSG